jgi:hypothetical protein
MSMPIQDALNTLRAVLDEVKVLRQTLDEVTVLRQTVADLSEKAVAYDRLVEMLRQSAHVDEEQTAAPQ